MVPGLPHLPLFLTGEVKLNARGLGRRMMPAQGVRKRFIVVKGMVARRVRLLSGWGIRAIRVLPAGTRIATLKFTDDPNMAWGTSKVKLFKHAKQPYVWALPPTPEHMGALVDSCEPGGKANSRFKRSSSHAWTIETTTTVRIGQVLRASYAERRGCEDWVVLSQRGAGRHSTRSALARAQKRNGVGAYRNRFNKQ